MKIRIFLLFLTLLALPAAAQRPTIQVQSGHTNRINALTLSGDGKLFATGSLDNTIRVWNVENGKLLHRYRNVDAVYSLAFYPGDRYLVSGDYGLSSMPIKVWNVDEGYPVTMDFAGGALSILVSPSEHLLAAGSSRGVVALWDLERGVSRWYYRTGTDYNMESLAYSPDNKLLSAGTGHYADTNFLFTWYTAYDSLYSRILFKGQIENIHYLTAEDVLVETMEWNGENSVYRCNIRTGERRFLFRASHVSLFGDDRYLAGQSGEKRISVYDLSTEKEVRQLTIREKYVDALAVTPDGSTLIAAGRDIEGIDLHTGESLYYIAGTRWIEGMAFSPAGNRLAFSGPDDEIISWDLKEGIVEAWRGHTGFVTDLFFDTQGNYLASASNDTTVIVWNPDGSVKHRFRFYNNDFHTVSMNPSADWLAVSEGDTIYSVEVERGVLGAKFSFGEGLAAERVIYSPNNRDGGYIIGNYLIVWDIIDEKYRLQRPLDGGLEDLAFSSDGRYIAAGGYTDTLSLFDLETGERLFYDTRPSGYVGSVAIHPNAPLLAAGYVDGAIRIFNFMTGELVADLDGHDNIVNRLSFRSDGQVLASSSWDGRLALWDIAGKRKLVSLYAFDDETWAVIDEAGRYDASNGGNLPHLHFVIGREDISLDQLKERYYEPGLLQKLLGFRDEPLRDVSVLREVKLFPQVALSIRDNRLHVSVTERSGGIGSMPLYINGKEVEGDISQRLQPTGDSLQYTAVLNILDYRRFLESGADNLFTIEAFNREGYLSSPRIGASYRYEQPVEVPGGGPSGFTALLKPRLYGLVVGTSDYRGTTLDLQFADKDAGDFALALEQAGRALFGEGFVDVHLYNTSGDNPRPSKEAIREGFRKIAEAATPKDVLVVYFSGHGVNHARNGASQFHYLTTDVESGDLSDDAIRGNYTISTEELTNWITEIPVQKQVLILDACASGQAIEDILVTRKSVSSGQVRALERLKDRTGMFILTGSASDKVSFEASRFGQSLLTYSLLAGMQGQALREGEFVDVLTLFEHSVDKVPELAEYIGGIQRPILAVPYGGNSFDIGRVDGSVRIDLEPVKPVFIRSNFQDEWEFADVLGLSERIDGKFRDLHARSKSDGFVFVDVPRYPDAFSIRGRYTREGESVAVSVRVFRGQDPVGSFNLDGLTGDLDNLVDRLVGRVRELVAESGQ